MGKIVFYEGRNYQGRHWECSSDCMDTYRYFNGCNSIRVSGGYWVAYQKPHYMGYQYILGPGDYPDYHSWMGFNNCIRSCQMFPPVSQSDRQIRIGSTPFPNQLIVTLHIKKLLQKFMSVIDHIIKVSA
ncbi:glutathione synthase [Goodea atripinnis]|uniref:Glutathione synthase n=1 Tax=Goodea atripinnis TaxID=208336 RepID=A0ABV0PL97_9TELE